MSQVITQLKDQTTLVKSLLKKYAEDSLSYFHLQEGRQYFFSPTGNSFLSYRVWNKVAIVASDPVGPKNEIAKLIKSFMQYADAWGLKPLFVGLTGTYLPTIAAMHMKVVKIGEEALIDLATFDEARLKKKVRRAVRHVEQEGVEVFFCTPADMPPLIAEGIRNVSSTWLKRNGNKEKGFSMTLGRMPDTLDKDCQFAIALKGNEVIGFLCFAPVYRRKMLSLDIERRKDNKLNGLTEFLIVKSAQYFREKGIKELSLNFATFSGLTAQNKSLKRKLLYASSQVMKRLFRTDSLYSFDQKFLPSWQDRYVAFPSARNLPLYLLALLRAER